MTHTTHVPTGIEAFICADIAQRQALGIGKYGTTVADNPLALREWLQHQYEELLDAAVYTRRAMAEIDKKSLSHALVTGAAHKSLLPMHDPMTNPEPLGDPRRNVPPIPVGIKCLHPRARLPTYATDGSACFDLYAVDVQSNQPHPNDPMAKWVRTGLAFSIPEGWMIEVHSRSGHGFKHALRLSNCTGIIDGDFTDELMISLRWDGERGLVVKDGDRIAQARIVPVDRAAFHWVEDIAATGRTGGLGSTGS